MADNHPSPHLLTRLHSPAECPVSQARALARNGAEEVREIGAANWPPQEESEYLSSCPPLAEVMSGCCLWSVSWGLGVGLEGWGSGVELGGAYFVV